MIAPGTLCYLTGDHCFAGACCTVTGPLERALCMALGFRRRHYADVYRVDIPRAGPLPSIAEYWVAEPRNLIPIAPPSPAVDLSQSEHAKRLRRMGAKA